MARFVQLIVQAKASDDYRGYVQWRESESEYYEAGLYEMRGEWGPTPEIAAQNAMRDWQDEGTRHFKAEWIGD